MLQMYDAYIQRNHRPASCDRTLLGSRRQDPRHGASAGTGSAPAYPQRSTNARDAHLSFDTTPDRPLILEMCAGWLARTCFRQESGDTSCHNTEYTTLMTLIHRLPQPLDLAVASLGPRIPCRHGASAGTGTDPAYPQRSTNARGAHLSFDTTPDRPLMCEMCAGWQVLGDGFWVVWLSSKVSQSYYAHRRSNPTSRRRQALKFSMGLLQELVSHQLTPNDQQVHNTPSFRSTPPLTGHSYLEMCAGWSLPGQTIGVSGGGAGVVSGIHLATLTIRYSLRSVIWSVANIDDRRRVP